MGIFDESVRLGEPLDRFLELRGSIVQITQALSARGFFGTEFGTAGNVSARFEKEELVGVTPSSHAYQDLKPEDIYLISVMPCTAKKFEAARPEMSRHGRSCDITAIRRR